VGGAGSIDQRQDLILIEVANRVRRLRGLSAYDRLPFRILLALSKADIWGAVTEPPIAADFGGFRAAQSIAVPPRDVLQRADATCRDFLARYMPELLATARALDPDVRIVPFSGLGTAPSSATMGARLAIRPRDVKPVWPAAPLVVALAEAEPALFPEQAIR
jgi:hypothetical protein